MDAAGMGLSFDQVVAGSYNIFARWGQNAEALAEAFGIRKAWSGGFRFERLLLGKKIVAALAIGEIEPYSRELNRERLLEIYLRRQINQWVNLSVHFQQLWHAAGTEENYRIAGLRTHFNI